jgi:virginiamycin B lyase
MRSLIALVILGAALASAHAQQSKYYAVPKGDFPHDVAAGAAGEVWYAGQGSGVAGRLTPATGEIERIPLGKNSAPHGVIVGPDGAPWLTDGGQNAIVRVDPATKVVKAWQLPKEKPYANLNTAAFDGKARIWFTGQSGVYGRLDAKTGEMRVWDAPKGHGPYGITATLRGDIWFVSLAGSYLANVDLESGAASVYEPPTKSQGARRVWSDSKGRLWISEWNSGNVGVYDPAEKSWKEWKLPGGSPRAYAVWVDPNDKVWLSDWPANAIVRFDPANEKFESFPSDRPNANVRQLLGRKGDGSIETWIAESGTERIRLIRHGGE